MKIYTFDDPKAAVPPRQSGSQQGPQREACVEFVKWSKERHLSSRAAHTALRVLHNREWEVECEKIRDAMRPRIDRMFEPAEKALEEGADVEEVLAALVRTLKRAEEM
jgi:hypothetical protein